MQLSEAEVKERVQVLGREITAAYQGEPLHLICVLNGAFLFMADLVRAVDLPLTLDFMAVSSYGSRTATSGEVRLTKDLDVSLKGRARDSGRRHRRYGPDHELPARLPEGAWAVVGQGSDAAFKTLAPTSRGAARPSWGLR